MQQMRILILSSMYPNKMNPNSGIFIHRQTRYLLKSGCRVKVVCPIPFAPRILWMKQKWKNYGQVPAFDVIDDVPIYYPRYLNLPGAWFHSLSCFSMYRGVMRIVDSIIKEFRPHVIHAHTATPAGYVALRVKKKYQLPLICSLRGSDINLYPFRDKLTMRLTKKVISEADQLISVSNALKKVAYTIATPKREIQIIYNGCDMESFVPNKNQGLQMRRLLRISIDDKVLVFIGSLSKNKGVFDLIASFEELFSIYDNIHLLMVGDGPEHTHLSRLISSKGMKGRVHMIGKQSPNEVPKYLSASDYFVIPTYFEGLPNAILEAMSCGLPVIGTNVGGIPEVVENGRNGILINKCDKDALTRAIKCLYEDEDLAKQMGSNGRKVIETSFSWQRNSEQLIGIYRELINTGN